MSDPRMKELDQIADTALALITDVREIDPNKTHAALTAMAKDQPGYFAKVAMALAIWVGEPTTRELQDRTAQAAIARYTAA